MNHDTRHASSDLTTPLAAAANTTARQTLKVRSGLKGGAYGGTDIPPTGVNHTLKVRTGLKAGGYGGTHIPPTGTNHTLKVRVVGSRRIA